MRTVQEALQRQSEAIRGHPRPSEAIRGHQRQSEAIRGHPRHSARVLARHLDKLLRDHAAPEGGHGLQLDAAVHGDARGDALVHLEPHAAEHTRRRLELLCEHHHLWGREGAALWWAFACKAGPALRAPLPVRHPPRR